MKKKGLLEEFMKDEPQSTSLKGKEKVIYVILNEVPSISQLKRQIHLLKESYVAPKSLEMEDVISFTKAELAPTTGKKLNLVLLDGSITHPNFQQFWSIPEHHRTYCITNVSETWVLERKC